MDADGLVLLSTKWVDGEPFVRARKSGEMASTLVPAVGLRLNYRLGPDPRRVCLGHTPFRKGRNAFHDCRKLPEPGTRRCERCTIVEATFASNLHHAHTRGRSELDPAVLEHLQQPNQLYLAAFRDGSIKVGTSTLTRLQERLTEQGAWIAHLVALTSDGFAVRDLEDRVTAEVGLQQSVNISRKLAGLVRPVDDDALVSRLERHGQQVSKLIERMSDSRIQPSHEMWHNPVSAEQALQKPLRYPLKLRSGSHDLEVVAAVGRIAAVRRPDTIDVFVIDLQELYGIDLELGDFESDEIAIQDSLF